MILGLALAYMFENRTWGFMRWVFMGLSLGLFLLLSGARRPTDP